MWSGLLGKVWADTPAEAARSRHASDRLMMPSSQFLQTVQEIERLARRELVRVDGRERLAQRVGLGRGLVFRGAGEQVRLAAARQARVLEHLQVPARAADHALRHARDRGDLQPVAL